MGTARRMVFPVLWLVVFGVIAAALFKLAFLDGLSTEADALTPSAQLQTATVAAARADVTNLVQAQGSIVSDPAVKVRSTSDGSVVFIDVEPGQQVANGDRLFQVKKPLEVQAAQPGPQDAGGDPAPAAAPVQLYTFVDVVSTSSGTLSDFPVLLNQEVTVGMEIASVDPGTFSVQASLSTDQQFRILDRPKTAQVTLNGGPAPFECLNISTGGAVAEDPAQAPAGPGAGPSTESGTFSCAVPAQVSVFAGLGATIDITAGEALDVLTVPSTAVRGAVQNGVVWVVADGGAGDPEERAVSLGLNDGQQVEITDGLADGEQILQFVPGAPAPEDGQFAVYGPGVMGG